METWRLFCYVCIGKNDANEFNTRFRYPLPNLPGDLLEGRFDGASLGDKRYMNIHMYHNALTKQKKKIM